VTEPAFSPLPGVPLALAEDLRLVLAPNPSPMTERGTNTWLLGRGAVTVIDPGPADPGHYRALLDALRGEVVTRIVVTHAHKDHSPLARPLAQATGAPVLAFGDALAGRSARMRGLGDLGGGEGVDAEFAPDERLADGDSVTAGGRALTALHTPGHFGNHLCLDWGSDLFSGDTVMGWAPSLVSPPDGDLTDFMASLDRLEALGPRRYLPGHGAPVIDGQARTRALRAHRLGREAAILAAIAEGADSLDAVTARVYADLPPAMWPMAARNVLAHVIDLRFRGLLAAGPASAGPLRLP
jgi:hydroxyacylglutathione hydrolase